MKDKPAIALAYIGDEQISWGRQAFAYPRHYFLMPSLLYLAEALRLRAADLNIGAVECAFLNTAMHNLDAMRDRLLKGNPAVVGLSCYSWNIGATLTLARSLKKAQPKLVIVVGGPEVTFPTIEEGRAFLMANGDINAVAMGEGEETIVSLIPVLLGQSPIKAIDGALIRDTQGHIVFGQARPDVVNLESQPDISISKEAAGIEHTPGCGVGIVYQTYRGCPYNCVYCGFDEGGHRVRSFPMEKIKRELKDVLDARVNLIHFADAVFDLRPARAKEILEHCREHGRETSLFCYAAMQRTDQQLAELLSDTKTQVGIGLQTTDEEVLKRVKRKFSVEKLFAILDSKTGRSINYYLDIMFGLPDDSLDGFRRTINAVLALDPPFIMPFPLTVVPRSELAADLKGFCINRYDKQTVEEQVRPLSGMTYAHIGLSQGFDLKDLRTFDHVATAIFYAFQRYPISIRMLSRYATMTKSNTVDAFSILERVGLRIREQVGDRAISIVNPPFLDGGMRESLASILADMGATAVELEALKDLLLVEAMATAIFNKPGRRDAYYKRAERSSARIDSITADVAKTAKVALAGPVRVVKVGFDYQNMIRLAQLRGSIEPRPGFLAIMAQWEDWIAKISKLDRMEAAVVETLPSSKEIQLNKIKIRMSRLEETMNTSWLDAVNSLSGKGIVDILIT